MTPTEPDLNFETLLDYLKRSRGFDFTGYKRSTLMRRIQRRMDMVGVDAFGDYVDFLEVHPDEFAQLFNMILINVTSFFRDAPIWEHIGGDILPRLLSGKAADAPVRVWSAGCASGEEPYTVAMLLAEAMGLDEFRSRVKIYGTDIDEDALGQARQAIYSERQMQDVPESFREKYFERVNHQFVFHRDLRRSVIFGRHDLIQDAPISRVDLLICRNTLMYFNAETQARIMGAFHFALNNNGSLLLGKAEMMFSHASLFVPQDLKRRVFGKLLRASVRERPLLALTPIDEDAYHLAHELRVRELVFDTEMAAQIVVDTEGRLALVNTRARLLFRLFADDLGRPLQDLEISYRPVELRSAIEQTLIEQRPSSIKDVAFTSPAGEAIVMDVQITPLTDGHAPERAQMDGAAAQPLGVSITFADVTYYKRLQDDLQAANQELETAYEEVQSTSEELETTNEELQSTNEELETINNELRDRGAQIGMLSAFRDAILTSLRGGVIVTDSSMDIQVWNRHAEELWGLRADETQGKNLLSLDIGLPLAQILPMLRACLAGESPFLETTLSALNRRGRTIQCHVSCTPLRYDTASVEGIIVLMEAQEDALPQNE